MENTRGLGGFVARCGLAGVRYKGIRLFTYNYPPGHPMRKPRLGKIEAFNWMGPGPRP